MANKSVSGASPYPHFATTAIHAGQDPEQWNSLAVVPPISLSTTFKTSEARPGGPVRYEYSRTGNPTRGVFEECVSALEGAKYGVAAGSGMAAATMLCQLLKTGDHVVSTNDCYGGTYRFFSNVLSNYGIETTYVDTTDFKVVEDAIRPNTKMLWMESLTNPLLRYTDLEAVVSLAKKKGGVKVIVDNTFMTPYFIRPLDFGVDIVYHSVTKYLNGHSDVVMGAICTNDEATYKQLKYLQNSSGCIPSPFDSYLANRGLKTLHVRMREHERNAMAIAQYLEASPAVERVIYPGLTAHPQHELMKKQTKGFSGMVTFFLKGDMANVKKFFAALKVIVLAESLGGYESLVDHPATMTHGAIPKEEREKIGVLDTLIRFSVGIEDVQDLIDDLDQALKASQ